MANNNPYSLSFNRDYEHYIDCGHSSSIDLNNNLTISLWVYLNSTMSHNQHLVCKGGSYQFSKGYTFYYASDSEFHFDLDEGHMTTIDYELNANQWYHIAVTYDESNNTACTYIDGNKIDETQDSSKSLKSTSKPLEIGKKRDGEWFDGKMDEVRIWNRALTQEEIQDKMNRYLNPSVETGLVAYYRMDDNSDTTTLVDATENNNHGTINGATYIPGEVDLLKPYKHLILDGTDIKTYNDGWSTLCQKGNQTESDFLNNGIDTLSNIPLEELQFLDNPEVIIYVDDPDKTEANLNIDGTINYLNMLESDQTKLLTWTDDLENTRQTKLNAIPNDQLITPNSDIDLSDVNNIDDITLTSNLSGNGDIKIVVSKDGGSTWQNVSTSTSITLNKTDISKEGITPTEFNNITSETWNDYIGDSNTLRFAYYLGVESEEEVAETDLLEMQVDLKGEWSAATAGTDYNYSYNDSDTIIVDLLKDGSYKINYQK